MGMHRASIPVLMLALGIGIGVAGTHLAGRDAAACGPVAATGPDGRSGTPPAAHAHRPAAFAPPAFSATRPVAGAAGGTAGQNPTADPEPDTDQLLKDLLTLAWNDRRDMRDKLEDFLVEHPGRDGIAIASRGVFDLAANADVLPDHALQALYLDQRDPEFKRVLAQVASMRGDNSLIELHAAEAATGLHAATPGERQQALTALARTRHVSAADLAAPLLRDPDTGVVLDALLALRASGNQRHVALAERLRRHPDESVRWLANDVAAELRMLSEHARTRLDDDELAAELPPLPLPPADGPAQCGRAAG
ncbi:HEAT repeat domain-containing protein [Luteimonas kalidii]|uniref:HEAT repeat domain-containing protein n=1 Tax=Luteimonas kalidii TaxID=3042025 RepID=A0ABT6JWZ4_9GAMM|nr:hypothetical protein [Luteimonas kalidii]MDH5835219.1 hypothetical protein [Luteimonas kalidii]